MTHSLDDTQTLASLGAANLRSLANLPFYRVIRMWTRDCVHTATNEPIPGLEEALCWRPSGNLVTSTATAAGRQQVKLRSVLTAQSTDISKRFTILVFLQNSVYTDFNIKEHPITVTQVIFMERNGLRHGEFPLSLHLPNTVVSGETYPLLIGESYP